jgi:predicted PurR-regulated permease PerM
VYFGQWLGFSSFIISLYILWQVRQLLLLIFTAIVFATALNRLVRCFQQLGFRRNWAIAITLSLSLTIVFLFFRLMVPSFLTQLQNLIELLPNVWERIRATLLTLRQQQLSFDWLPSPPALTDLMEQLQPLGTVLFRKFFAFFSNSLTAVLQLLLVLALTLMMLVNPRGYRQACLKLFPSFYRRRADEIFSEAEVALGNWLGGIIFTSTLIGILSGIGLWILQIKLVLVHALLAGLLNLIPNIGPATSVIFPIMMALLDAPWKIWFVLALYFTVQQLESYLLTPSVMAKQLSLLPAVTLVAQIFFAQTFGLLGLLLALPLTVVVKTWIEEALFKDILDRWKIPPSHSLSIGQSLADSTNASSLE